MATRGSKELQLFGRSLGRHLAIRGVRSRHRDRFPGCTKTFNVKLNRILHFALDFGTG